MPYPSSDAANLVVHDNNSTLPYTSDSINQKWRSSLRRIRYPSYRSTTVSSSSISGQQKRTFCRTSRLLYIALLLHALGTTTAAAAALMADNTNDGSSMAGDLASAVEQTTSICVEYPRLSLCQLRPMLENALTEIDFLVNGIGLVNTQGASEGIYTDIRPAPDDTVSGMPSAVILQGKMRRRRSGSGASATPPRVRRRGMADGHHIAALLMSGGGDDDVSSSAEVDVSTLGGEAESAMPTNLWRRIRVEKAKKRKEK